MLSSLFLAICVYLPAQPQSSIDGNWKLVHMSLSEGGKVSQDHWPDIDSQDVFRGRCPPHWRFRDGNLTETLDDIYGKNVFTQNRKYRESKEGDVRTIDVTRRTSDGAELHQAGMFAIDGDTLRIALGKPGSPRPISFDVRPEPEFDGVISLKFRRVREEQTRRTVSEPLFNDPPDPENPFSPKGR